ncbi:MAG: ABC transporter permease [Chloroflexi bacterium]|jgi:peptide/nickel transport system permease protein|nr:ABC transporter permease [Chloroflexota bacterium]
MLHFVLRRLLLLIPTVIVISMISFLVIQLPPGDYLTSYVISLEAQGQFVDQELIDALRVQYGLGQPLYVQYGKWVWGMLHGHFGQSLQWKAPVADLIWERLGLTVVLSLGSLLFVWLVAFPIGIYSAVRQYSVGDYVFTALSFFGLGIPDFLLALIVMWLAFSQLGISVGGLFSNEFVRAPWSWAKLVDMLKHAWMPMVVLGIGGTAGLIRIMRANLLDELNKPYVETARAKGLRERRLILKYPVRVALNPFVSTLGWTLPSLVSGSVIVSVVLSLPTTGPLLLTALQAQDMYLAGTFLLMLSILTVLGTLVSDVLLALLDPRIRVE